jgi:hypothetical protein
MRELAASLIGQLFGQVKSHSLDRFQVCQKIAGATAQFQYPCSWGDHAVNNLTHLGMIEHILIVPVVPYRGGAFKVFTDVLFRHSPLLG